VRRIAVYAIIAALLFGVLWYTIVSAVTASLIAASGTGILVVGSTVSDIFESLFELLASIVLGLLAAIAAVFAAIFSFFD
jgi:H+/Cl- antiporter ClcA